MNPLDDIRRELEDKGGTASFVRFVTYLLEQMDETSDPKQLNLYKHILNELEILPMGEKYNFDTLSEDAEQYQRDKEHLRQRLMSSSEFNEEEL